MFLIPDEDYNDASDDNLYKQLPRSTQIMRFKCTTVIADELAIEDVWRSLNPHLTEIT